MKLILERIRQRTGGEQGQALILFAAGLIGAMGLVGMSVDIGHVAWAHGDMQRKADAAALAGAQDLPTANTALSTANNYLTLNGGASCQPNCGTVSGSNSVITVTATRHIDYWFLSVLGLSGADVSKSAQARATVVTGFNFDSGDVFPYAVWGGNPTYPNCNAPYGICTGASKTYRANQWDNQVAQSQRQNGRWTVPGNNFKGYFNVSNGAQVYQADPNTQYSFGGNAVGQQPIDALHAHFASGKPIILPVITYGSCTNNCGTLTFTIVGWVALRLTVDPGSTSGDFKGDVVGNFLSQKGVGGGYVPGGSYPPIKTITMTG